MSEPACATESVTGRFIDMPHANNAAGWSLYPHGTRVVTPRRHYAMPPNRIGHPVAERCR